MPRNGSGNFSYADADFVTNTVISSTVVNSKFSDTAQALSASIAKDGQTVPTANLPMGTYRHTGVGNATARTDYAAAGQVQDSSFTECGTAGGTKNALTLTPSPAISAYAAGQRFHFKAGSTQSDDAVTIAVSGLAAKAAQINDSALSATSYIEANKHYEALYDGATFQLTRLSSVTLGLLPDPMTTRGDVIYRNASNVTSRLAIGAADTALCSDGADASWATVQKPGTQTIWVPSGAMVSRTTNGAASGTSESTTNKVMIKSLDFDTATQEFAQFNVRFPKSWDEGTVTFAPIWTATSGSGGVVWGLQGVSLSDDDAIDSAYGTAQTSTDTLITANDIHVGPTSSAITIAGTPAVGDWVSFQINRTVSDGSDTLGVDARLIGVALFFTTNAANDA